MCGTVWADSTLPVCCLTSMCLLCRSSLYQRAIHSCGGDYRSAKIWDAFIDWEMSSGRLRRVMAIYDQLLAIPTQQLLQHFEKYVSYSSPPSSFLCTIPVPPPLPPSLLFPSPPSPPFLSPSPSSLSPSHLCHALILSLNDISLLSSVSFKKLLETTPTSQLLCEEEYQEVSSQAGDASQGEVRVDSCSFGLN